MVWYIQNISDQPDHCSKHQLRRKISEKKLSKRRLLQKEMTKGWCCPVCSFDRAIIKGRVVCLYFCTLRCVCQQSNRDGPGGSPVTKAPSPSFTTTLWEGHTHPQQKYHPPQLHPFDPKPSPLWDNLHTVHSTNPLLPTICLPSTQN